MLFGKRKKKSKYSTEFLDEIRLKELQNNDAVLKKTETGETICSDEGETEDIKTLDEKKQFIINCCDRIAESNKRVNEQIKEYEAVNSYISDIQTIENLPEAQAKEVNYLAKKVVVLEKDRKDFGHSMSKLTNRQFSHMREHEDDITNILKNMSEDEKYCETVKTDMRYLEGEKAALIFEKKEMKNRLYLIKGAARIGFIAFAILIILLLVINFSYNYDTSIYMYIVIGFTTVFSGGLFIIHNKTVYELKLAETRLNRAIGILNKIKIKYVNVVSRLEYSYEKHQVKSSYQLSKIWGTYLQLQKEHQVYNRASAKLIEAEEQLVALLTKYNVKDSNVWINQVYALVDKSEMSEIKNHLNKRREKIKSSFDYNKQVSEKAGEDIKKIVLGDKDNARELMAIIDAYE